MSSDERLWQPVIDRLHGAISCTVVRAAGSSIDAMADSVLARAPDRFYLAGVSMGGYVCLDAVLKQPERVAGVALLNTSARAASPERKQGSLETIALIRSGQFAAAVQRVTGIVAPTRPDVTAVAAAMAYDLGAGVSEAHQLAVMNRRDRRSELSQIAVPTLVLAGGDDAISPPSLSEELASAIVGAELRVLDGVGHLSPLEAPAEIASELLRWLSLIEERSAS